MRIVLVVNYILCFCSFITAQCPDRMALRSRIYELRYSTVSPKSQLEELLPISIQLEKCPQANDSVRILLLQRLGALFYMEGKFLQAVSYTESAIGILQDKKTTYADPAFLIKVYDFLQVYYDSLKLLNKKMNAIDSCIHYALLTNRVDEQILYNIWQRSAYSLDVGDFQRCASYSLMGESLTEKYAPAGSRLVYIMNFFTNRMNGLIGLNELDTAEKELFKKISVFKAAGLEDQCCAFYDQLSTIATKRADYNSALSYLEKSLKCNRQGGYMLQCKQILNNIGFIYVDGIQNPRKALDYFTQALGYKSLVPEEFMYDEIETVNVLDNIGIAYSMLKLYDSSFYYFQRAFDIIGPGSNENTIANMAPDRFILNPKLNYVAALVRQKGNAYARRYRESGNENDLNDALRVFKMADKILTKLKAAQTELQSKLAWRTSARVLYQQAINLCYMANRPEDAFYFFERSRAVLLNDQIFLNRSLSKNDISTRSQLELKIEKLKSQLGETLRDSDEYTEIQKTILFLTQQRDRINAQNNHADSTGLTLPEFRKKYDLGQATIIELFAGDTAAFILSITKNKIGLKKIDGRKFASLSTSFTGFVSDAVKTNGYYSDFLSVSNRLYHLIFDSLQVEGRLIVSPDEYYFPFEALVTSVRNGIPEYLVKSRSVVYTYSANYLLLDFNANNNHSAPLILGMAPVHFPSVYGLTSLQGSDESLKKILSEFSASQSIVNTSATKSEFLNSFYKYRIVQLYTHGAETGKSGVPVIYFADSALNLFDLIPVNKPATQLVVLSACESAKGKYYKGEGVFSFNRAFAEAGIPSSMVNLWSVDNQSSYRLTELFYKYLPGMTFDEALRKAKVEFIATSGKEKSLPFYWAATVLAGRSSTIQEESGMSWMVIAGIFLVAIALVIGLFRLFKRSEPYNSSSTARYW